LFIALKLTDISRISVVVYVLDHSFDVRLQLTEYYQHCCLFSNNQNFLLFNALFGSQFFCQRHH